MSKKQEKFLNESLARLKATAETRIAIEGEGTYWDGYKAAIESYEKLVKNINEGVYHV